MINQQYKRICLISGLIHIVSIIWWSISLIFPIGLLPNEIAFFFFCWAWFWLIISVKGYVNER